MELALISLEKIVEMAFMLLLGVMLFRVGIIDSEMNKKLSNFLLLFVCPFLLFTSLQVDLTPERLRGFGQAFALSAVCFASAILMTRFLVPKSQKYDTALERICLIYSNCGFIGLPLLNALFGRDGVLYMTAYMVWFNFLLWTQGVGLFEKKKQGIRSMLVNLRTPVIISILIGLVFFFTGLRMPALLESPMEMIGNMNTPLAMLVAGVSLAESDIAAMLRKTRIYYISFLKLFVCPLLVLLLAGWAGFDELPFMTVYIAAACPSGTSGTLFALRYGRDNHYATELLAVTTVLSIVTIPAMILLKKALFP